MRCASLLPLVATTLLGCGGASPRPDDGRPKIGTVDVRRVLMRSRMGKESMARLEARKRELQREVDAKKKAEAAARGDQEKRRQHDELVQLFSSSQNELSVLEDDLGSAVLEHAKSAAETIGTKGGYAMITDRRGQLLWRSEGALPAEEDAQKRDVTDEVIRVMDAEAPP